MLKFIIQVWISILLFSCSSHENDKDSNGDDQGSSESPPSKSSSETESDGNLRSGENNLHNSSREDDESLQDGGENSLSDNGKSKFPDGSYSATVDYNNPLTGYSQTYTLEVEVSDCQVVEIDFPKGGYLDEDHISAADLDEDGNAEVEGEDGKTYGIHIEQ